MLGDKCEAVLAQLPPIHKSQLKCVSPILRLRDPSQVFSSVVVFVAVDVVYVVFALYRLQERFRDKTMDISIDRLAFFPEIHFEIAATHRLFENPAMHGSGAVVMARNSYV